MAVIAQSGTPTQVSFTHALPATYPEWIPVDTRLTPLGNQVRVMTHLHGGFVAADSDGNPAVTPNGFGPGQTQTVFYTNQLPQMPASLLWFHDHGLGATRLNVFAGLAAAYILRDQFDTGGEPNPIGIPGGPYEIPLVVQDRQFNPDGTFLYPTSNIPGVTWIGEYFGDVMLVNGKVWPFLDVEPRLYRFRILNGCNARILNLDIPGVKMSQIGAEGGLWDAPVPVTQLVLAPAERADVIVDFSTVAGQRLQMSNQQPPRPITNRVATPAPNLTQVMQIRVGTTVTQPGPTTIPSSLPGRAADLSNPVKTRFITLNEVAAETADWFLNLNAAAFSQASEQDANPAAGTVEDWVYINMTGDTHPMHTHLVTFQVVGRTPFDVAAYQAAQRRPERRSRWDRSDPVRDRGHAPPRPDGARLQGYCQGQPRVLHEDQSKIRFADRRVRAADLCSPLPHRRARGQRHDAAVHSHVATHDRALEQIPFDFTHSLRA